MLFTVKGITRKPSLLSENNDLTELYRYLSIGFDIIFNIFLFFFKKYNELNLIKNCNSIELLIK